MKILVPVQFFDPPYGGAEHSLQVLLNCLSMNHEVYVLQPGEINSESKIGDLYLIKRKMPIFHNFFGYYPGNSNQYLRYRLPLIIQAYFWKIVVSRFVKNNLPDLIITQGNYAPSAIGIAKRLQIPSIFFVRSYQHFCLNQLINGPVCNHNCSSCLRGIRERLYYLFWKRWLDWNKYALQNANLVITNSKYVSNIVKTLSGVDSQVLYPSIDIEPKPIHSEFKKYITIINPSEQKGGDIFLKIVDKLPNRNFLAVGVKNQKFVENAKKFSNIVIAGWTNDIDQIFSKTRILLSPARWPEPFGRVVIEAGSFGIPSIVSNRGGLPESVGDGGILIDEIDNIDLWVKAIEDMDDQGFYELNSKKAFYHSQLFSYNLNYKKFLQIVENNLAIHL